MFITTNSDWRIEKLYINDANSINGNITGDFSRPPFYQNSAFIPLRSGFFVALRFTLVFCASCLALWL